MTELTTEQVLEIDRQHIWHPYASMTKALPQYVVASAEGVRLTLADGRELIDGMASWWSVIHGYNHPALNQALQSQSQKMSHVMFGGLTHEPAARLAKLLVDITPTPLQKVFFSDSGSVAVEVAIKMAIQYWHAAGQPLKQRLISLRGGYHGDTFAAMSVCDPVTGMHELFNQVLPQQLFAEAPQHDFYSDCDAADIEADIKSLAAQLAQHQHQIAAVIVEPIVQGAGGMRFYSPKYLNRVRQLCDQYEVLLICDEIATGFGRTGKLFACEHAGISADILCLGKALTGGTMSLAATLTTAQVSQTICDAEPEVFMHGPTFMGNPLACSVAVASIELLLNSPWQEHIAQLQQGLEEGLAPAREFDHVKEVRILGGIGVVEMKAPVQMQKITAACVEQGIWVRPFGKLVYLMPPYVISPQDLQQLTSALLTVIEAHRK
jgi:adenosylmethionine---8-amino-7-oxononanoate aminotransferase